MFSFLYRTFYYDTFTYETDLHKDTIVEKINHLTYDTPYSENPNLKGRFVDYPNSFFLTQKRWNGHIKGLEKEPALLKGVITTVKNKRTQIEIAVRPNSVFPFFFLIFLPFGLYLLYKAILFNDLNSMLGGLWILLGGLPFVTLLARHYTKTLRKILEEYLELK